jgi:GDPmannose 4,6-dehydratase
MRPEELKYLKGDSTKMRKEFGWEPEYSFESLMDEMIEHWEEQIRINNIIDKHSKNSEN